MSYRAPVTNSAAFTSGQVLVADDNGSSCVSESASALLDAAFGSTEGQILQRGPSVWQVLATGTSGQFLQTGGSGALASWSQHLSIGSVSLDVNFSGTTFASVTSTATTIRLASADTLQSGLTLLSNSAFPAVFLGAKNLGTMASPSAITTGSAICAFNSGGYTGSGWANQRFLATIATENWSSTAIGQSTNLYSVLNTTVSLNLEVTIQNGLQICNAGTTPTGGAKGGGTINVQSGYYRQGVMNGTQGYTVATLPAAPGTGARAYVTDATAPTFLGTLTGGGTVVCPVFYNGAAWVAG